MSQSLSLDDRMKDFYEHRFRIYLPRRIPVILRIDGKAFHSTTRGFDKPWDTRIVNAIRDAAIFLCEETQGCKLAYFQSDEISLLLTDYDNITTEAWFDYNLQKLTSVAASLATLGFNRSLFTSYIPNITKALTTFNKIDFLFDARTFVLPKEEVANYFIWRQQDATRNSINSLARKYFSHSDLANKRTDQVQELLLTKQKINWNDIPTWQKRGACIIKMPKSKEDKNLIWKIDENIPIFTQDRNYIERYVYLKEADPPQNSEDLPNLDDLDLEDLDI